MSQNLNSGLLTFCEEMHELFVMKKVGLAKDLRWSSLSLAGDWKFDCLVVVSPDLQGYCPGFLCAVLWQCDIWNQWILVWHVVCSSAKWLTAQTARGERVLYSAQPKHVHDRYSSWHPAHWKFLLQLACLLLINTTFPAEIGGVVKIMTTIFIVNQNTLWHQCSQVVTRL